MRVKASYTVENSFIMPCFIFFIMFLLFLCFYIHDSIILSNTALKLAIKAEYYNEDWQLKEIKKQGINYNIEKTIYTRDLDIIIDNKKDRIIVTCTGKFLTNINWINKLQIMKKSSTIYKSHADSFIRYINAIEDAVN